MKNASHFAKGTGVYQCQCCTRSTRSTGRGDNENVELCAECYDLAGFENSLQDGEQLKAGDRAEIDRLIASVKEKGGDHERAFDKSMLERAGYEV
jgi:hypothetical protein